MTTLQIFDKEVKVSLATSQAFPANKDLYLSKYNYCRQLLEKLEAAKGEKVAQDNIPYYVQCVWSLYIKEGKQKDQTFGTGVSPLKLAATNDYAGQSVHQQKYKEVKSNLSSYDVASLIDAIA